MRRAERPLAAGTTVPWARSRRTLQSRARAPESTIPAGRAAPRFFAV